MTDTLEVVLDDATLGAEEVVVGTLFRERSRGQEVISFAYDRAYLSTPTSIQLDPELPLVPGRFKDILN